MLRSQISQRLHIQRQVDSRRAVLKLSGEVDLETAPQLAEQLRALEAQTPTQYLVDLSDVDFIDSTGLGVIVRAQKAADANGHSLVFRRGSLQVQRLFALTALTDRLTFED